MTLDLDAMMPLNEQSSAQLCSCTSGLVDVKLYNVNFDMTTASRTVIAVSAAVSVAVAVAVVLLRVAAGC